MRIAICDAETNFSEKLKRILYEYSNIHKLDFFVEIFSNGDELLKSDDKYTMLFIEYSPSKTDALKTAIEFRKYNNTSGIVFFSENITLVSEIFTVKPHSFLTKPLSKNSIFKTLNDFFKNNEIHHHLWLHDRNNTFCFDTNEIIYLEASNKYCFVHLIDNVIFCKKTMARVFEALPKFNFQKINRAYIVNMNCINQYNNDYVFLKNGEDLHITRTYYKDFKENFFKYSKPRII